MCEKCFKVYQSLNKREKGICRRWANYINSRQFACIPLYKSDRINLGIEGFLWKLQNSNKKIYKRKGRRNGNVL